MMHNVLEPISREEAERLFQNSNPQNSHVEQKGAELKVSVSLPNASSLLIVYNTGNHKESFFIVNASRSVDDLL